MEKYSAEIFYKIGALLGNTIQALGVMEREGPETFPDLTPSDLAYKLKQIGSYCGKISLKQSEKFIQSIVAKLSESEIHAAETKIRLESLQELMYGEMEDSLFLWVPSDRSEFYGMDAEALIGAQCCARFKSIQREVEEAAKCYALGRWTACAFHLMRSTEAGVKALARAIGYTPPHDQWDLVFKQMRSEFALKPSLRPAHWQTHGRFLEKVWGDLRAVNKAWRNDIAHLVATYTEDESKKLLTVIPMFLRDLATKMNENGKLF